MVTVVFGKSAVKRYAPEASKCGEDCSFHTLIKLETIIGHTFSIQVNLKSRQPV